MYHSPPKVHPPGRLRRKPSKELLLVAEEAWLTNERKSPERAINNMSHLGLLSFPGTGHLNPLAALGRQLQQRGHQVTVFQIADLELTIRAAGLHFIQFGLNEFSPRRLTQPNQHPRTLSGFSTTRKPS